MTVSRGLGFPAVGEMVTSHESLVQRWVGFRVRLVEDCRQSTGDTDYFSRCESEVRDHS